MEIFFLHFHFNYKNRGYMRGGGGGRGGGGRGGGGRGGGFSKPSFGGGFSKPSFAKKSTEFAGTKITFD